jgi:hypothetical protein
MIPRFDDWLARLINWWRGRGWPTPVSLRWIQEHTHTEGKS